MAGRETAVLHQVHKSYLLSAGCTWATVTAGRGGKLEKRNVAWDLESQHPIQQEEKTPQIWLFWLKEWSTATSQKVRHVSKSYTEEG